MKRTLFSLLLLAASASVSAQLGGLKNKINQKVNQKVDQQIDKEIDKAVDGDKSKKEKSSGESTGSGEVKAGSSPGDNSSSASADPKAAVPAFASYSKFDFVPGEKVLAFDDFSTDNIGDFPAKWNTNGSGEVVTLSTLPGKFFAMGQHANYRPEYINYNLPDNYTLEFDAAFNETGTGGSFYVMLGHSKEKTDLSPDASGFQIQFVTSGSNYVSVQNWCYLDECKGTTAVSNTAYNNFGEKGEKVRVSLWRQKQRIRVYVNDTKVFDLPRALDATLPMNCISFKSYSGENSKYAYITNMRLAAGNPDTRNKLVTEGKFVTSGILFDQGSEKIKPESYGVLRDIANVLKENGDIKVKIIGHTDSDGDDKKNLELSVKRAGSVKAALTKEFAIDEARMETDGKGETVPVTPNTTPEGKANNRRVEFIKL